VPGSNRAAIAMFLFAVLVSALWIDVLPWTSASVATGHVPQEAADYVYFLQSRPLNVEFRQVAEVVPVDGAGAAGLDAQQVADENQAVNAGRSTIAASGLPVEPMPAAGVISLAGSGAKRVASGRAEMHMIGGVIRTKVADYLWLGSETMSKMDSTAKSITIIASCLLILFMLGACTYFQWIHSRHHLIGPRSPTSSASQSPVAYAWKPQPGHYEGHNVTFLGIPSHKPTHDDQLPSNRASEGFIEVD